MALCEFGCERKALFTFKTGGKHCCSKSCNSCPAMKIKNGASKKGKNPFEGREHHRCRAGVAPWNKGLTADSDRRVKLGAKKMRKTQREQGGSFLGKHHTPEAKAKISQAMREAGAGGYRKGSGRGRKGWYKGIFCDSSWELAFVLWCEMHGRKVKRAKKTFTYKYQGHNRKYLPDFRYLCQDGVWRYLEVKGYVSEQWKAKKKAFPHELLMVTHRVMKKVIFPYVIPEYGEDFIRLYEK